MTRIERRSFISTMAATAAGTTTAAFAAGPVIAAVPQESPRLNVTVLRVTLDEDLDREYRDGGAGPCPVFQEGLEFIIDSPFLHPDGFCHWAWADIRSFIQESYFGREDPIIACCTDGIRPVFFKIERMET